MEKKIRSDLMKMAAIMIGLVGLGIYARDFVIAGIEAKMALNLSIFGLFGIAAGIAFKHVIGLKNEIVAMKALQVDYGTKERRPKDPYQQPAIVFHEPELLGQGYRLIAEEMGKQDGLNISNGEVQTILHDVDMRINDRKSTIMYFSGLMVFLGLLGAFMGLMKTVHAVSDLIGSMDMSGGSDSFGAMIEGMKAPLNGMSVGFSSSLFGLLTSMVLGALERFMTGSMKTVRNEFEHWLSNVASLDATSGESGQRESAELGNVIRALDLGGRHLRDLRETLLDSSMAQQETQAAVTAMSRSVETLNASLEKIYDPEPLLRPISECVAELARNQTMMIGQFHALIQEAQQDRASIRDALEALRAAGERQSVLDGGHVHTQLDRIAALQAELLAKEAVVVTAPMAADGGAGGTGLLSRIAAKLGLDRESRALRRERRQLHAEIRQMLNSQRRLTRKVDDVLGGAIGRLEADRLHEHSRIDHLVAQNDANSARLAVLLERLRVIDEAGAQDPAGLSVATGLHGARLEMEILKHRLHADEDAGNGAEESAMMQQHDNMANAAGLRRAGQGETS